jgi:hypothetical protein
VSLVKFKGHSRTLAQARLSSFADNYFDPRAQLLGRANLVKQPPCEAVLGLARHREKHMLGSDDGVASRCSEFAG